MNHPILPLQNTQRGFTDYFRSNIPIDDVASALGYRHQRQRLILPTIEETPAWAEVLQIRAGRISERVALDNETAKREMLIAPILSEVVLQTDAQMKIEYPIHINDHLQGKLDYLLAKDSQLLVVEAKRGDLVRGMTQLLAEMAALDAWLTEDSPELWGCLTLGESWRFAVLDRKNKIWTQDTAVLGLPGDMPLLARTLVAIVTKIYP